MIAVMTVEIPKPFMATTMEVMVVEISRLTFYSNDDGGNTVVEISE